MKSALKDAKGELVETCYAIQDQLQEISDLETAIKNGGVIKSIFRTDTFCTDEDMVDYDSNDEGFQLKQI